MRYVGGKSKIARKISAVMLEKSQGRDLYIEPFVRYPEGKARDPSWERNQ